MMRSMSNQAEESFINLTINKNVPETIPEDIYR